MAKQNMPKVSTENEEVVTINLQNYLTPIAIIVSGIMISLSLFLSGRTSSVISTDTPDTETPDTAGEQVEANPAAVTSIDDDPYLGNIESATVAVVEFSDYECPFCQRHHQQVFPSIKSEFIDTGKIIYVYRDYIAVPSHNPVATTEAYAASCVRELSNSNSKYFEYGDLLYSNTKTNGAGLEGTDVYQLACSIGINADQLKNCIDSAKYKDEIASDEQAASDAGVQGTPGFIVGVLNDDGSVNGKLIAGAYPYETFKTIIDEMLAK